MPSILVISSSALFRESAQILLVQGIESVAIQATATVPEQFSPPDMVLFDILDVPLDDPAVQNQLAALRKASDAMRIVVLAGVNPPPPVLAASVDRYRINYIQSGIDTGLFVTAIRFMLSEAGQLIENKQELNSYIKKHNKYNIPMNRGNTEIDLPEKPPVLWPGARRADLVQFLEDNYRDYIGLGLTLKWIKQHDPRLYKSIENHKQRVGPLPFDIPSQGDRLTAAIEKLRTAGSETLTPKERTAVGRKAQRLGYGSPSNG